MCLYIVAGRLYCIIFSWILFWSKLFFYGSSGIIVAFKFVSCFSLLGRVRVSMKVQHGSNPQLLVCKNHNSTVYVKLVAVHALASVGLLDPHFTSFFLYFLSFSLLLSFAIHTLHLITQSSAIFGRITAIMIRKKTYLPSPANRVLSCCLLVRLLLFHGLTGTTFGRNAD